MNHLKIYESIIENAKLKNRNKLDGIYYENHHIIPVCLNGSNKKENKVLLTAREHFICHKLLTYIHKGNVKISYVFHMMSTIKNKKIIYKVSAREYENAQKEIKAYLLSDEIKQKRKDTIYKKKYSPEAIQRYLNSIKNVHYSPNENSIIHISFNDKNSNSIIIESIKQDIRYLNKQGCYVGSNI